MVRHHVVLALLLGVAPSIAIAEQRGVARPTLEVELVVAAADDDQLRRWATDQPGALFETLTEVRAGQTAIAQARVRGCMPGDSGRCSVTVQYVATGPNGQTFREEAARPLEVGKPAPALRLDLSKTDEVGLYKVVTFVRDLNAKRIVRSERIFGLRLE